MTRTYNYAIEEFIEGTLRNYRYKHIDKEDRRGIVFPDTLIHPNTIIKEGDWVQLSIHSLSNNIDSLNYSGNSYNFDFENLTPQEKQDIHQFYENDTSSEMCQLDKEWVRIDRVAEYMATVAPGNYRVSRYKDGRFTPVAKFSFYWYHICKHSKTMPIMAKSPLPKPILPNF